MFSGPAGAAWDGCHGAGRSSRILLYDLWTAVTAGSCLCTVREASVAQHQVWGLCTPSCDAVGTAGTACGGCLCTVEASLCCTFRCSCDKMHTRLVKKLERDCTDVRSELLWPVPGYC